LIVYPLLLEKTVPKTTLAISKDAPVGFKTIRLNFKIDGDADEDQLKKLVELTKSYCVVYQTLVSTPPIVIHITS